MNSVLYWCYVKEGYICQQIFVSKTFSVFVQLCGEEVGLSLCQVQRENVRKVRQVIPTREKTREVLFAQKS